jgi:hypothetical protein
MAKKPNIGKREYLNSSNEEDSEQELPGGFKRLKKREDSAGFLGANSPETNPLINTDKHVTFSSNRRKQMSKNKANQKMSPHQTLHTKTASAVTTKEQSLTSMHQQK